MTPSRRSVLLVAAFSTAFLGSGCGGRTALDGPTDPSDPSEQAGPPAPVLAIPTPRPALTYPQGPYGKTEGSIIPNLTWAGYRIGRYWDEHIELLDYYDPDGSKGITALRLMMGAVWCGVDNSEAERLRTLYPKVEAEGARFISGLIEDATKKPSTRATLDTWIRKYAVTYDLVMDPAKSMAPATGSIGLPYNVIVDPRTMKIFKVIPGAGPSVDAAVLALITKNRI